MYFATPQFVDWYNNKTVKIILRNIELDFRLKSTAFENKDEIKDPQVAALLNTSFQGLPPCLLITAELDRFRDDSYGINENKK